MDGGPCATLPNKPNKPFALRLRLHNSSARGATVVIDGIFHPRETY